MPIGLPELAVLMLIAGVPLVLGIAFIVLVLMRSRSGESERRRTSQTPLEILQEQYARGEIDSEEYEERRRKLSDPSS